MVLRRMRTKMPCVLSVLAVCAIVQTQAAAADCTHAAPLAHRASFERLYAAWHRESARIRFSSRTSDYVALPSFRKIIGLGPGAVPLLRSKLVGDRDGDFMLAEAVVTICGWDLADFAAASEQSFRDKVLERLGREGR